MIAAAEADQAGGRFALARRSAGSAVRRRVIGSVVAFCAAGILGVAAWLTPSPLGVGTHDQLGMPPCGWIALLDLPCPTCGMTTAFAHAADGHLAASFLAQPLGCVLAIVVAMSLLLGVYVAATGSRLASSFTRLWGRHAGWWLCGIVLAAWGYKILAYKIGL